MYVAVVPNGVIGGGKRRGREILCIRLIGSFTCRVHSCRVSCYALFISADEPDFFPKERYGIDAWSCARSLIFLCSALVKHSSEGFTGLIKVWRFLSAESKSNRCGRRCRFGGRCSCRGCSRRCVCCCSFSHYEKLTSGLQGCGRVRCGFYLKTRRLNVGSSSSLKSDPPGGY